MNILLVIGIIIVILILVLLGAFLMGVSRSKKSKIIKPEGAVTGKALVVYDAGFTGGTKNAAGYIAEDLKSKGYEVKLAGVRSSEALDTSGYNILIIGSPTYGGKPTKPIESYLRNLKPTENIVIGIYSLSGGNMQDSNVFMAQMLKDKSIPAKIAIKYEFTLFGAGDKNKYSGFVSELLK